MRRKEQDMRDGREHVSKRMNHQTKRNREAHTREQRRSERERENKVHSKREGEQRNVPEEQENTHEKLTGYTTEDRKR